ncbi:hypothetical protein Ancab_034984 [Ancistrocladus abbreviatus]
MAAISLTHCLRTNSSSIKEQRNIALPPISIPFSSQNTKPNNQTKAKEKENKLPPPPPPPPPQWFLDSVWKLGKELKENLSPKQKGDWKDLMLMSLSFAVYVYMSQQIVCTYCAWMSMLK